MIDMAENEIESVQPYRRLRFEWLTSVILHPRRAFEQIAAQPRGVWLVPMLALTLTTLGRVLVSGSIRQQILLSSGPFLPPDFQYYSPEQQAQFMQASQATTGPVFMYIFPALAALLGIWIGWLLVSGLLHLVVTLLGGRGETVYSINLVAWAGLPFVIRDLVQVVAMLVTDQLIENTGLSGFAPADPTGGVTYLAALLSLVDIYLIWHIMLLIIGVRAGNGLSSGKAASGVLFTIGLVVALQALIDYLINRLGSLTIVRPFF
jgi:hypothetical protein